MLGVPASPLSPTDTPVLWIDTLLPPEAALNAETSLLISSSRKLEPEEDPPIDLLSKLDNSRFFMLLAVAGVIVFILLS